MIIVLKVYIWFTASGLSDFMSSYGNLKHVTAFIKLLESNDGGARSLRFFKGDYVHKGYSLNAKYLPSQLVRRLFSLVCIVKNVKKYYALFFQLVREEIVPLLESFCMELDIEEEMIRTEQAAILAECHGSRDEPCNASLEEEVDAGDQVGKTTSEM